MERLTVRVKEGNRKDECFIPGNKNAIEKVEYISEGGRWESEEYRGKAVDKLAEYEDLEEQGKLLKLPCKAGQKVYLLRKDIKKVIDGEITSMRIGEFASEMKIFIIDDNRYTESSFDKIGDIVFFTRQEAEDKLAEMEGKNGN